MKKTHGRRITIANTAARRTLAEACALGGIPTPTTAAGVADAYLMLVVLGVDHARVGLRDWYDAVTFGAPHEASVIR